MGAAFTSSGGTASGTETTLLSILQILLIHGMIIQGRSKQEHYSAAAAVGTPNNEESQSCHDFSQRTANLTLNLFA